MEIILTDHVRDKMCRRYISEEEVLSAIKYSERSEKRHGKQFFEKNISRGTIEVCCKVTEKHINVLTVYWL